jgi:pyrroline-5-carboxylate reductase
MMEALESAALAVGLDAAQARLLTLETAFGAAKMALASKDDPATLRKQVTSPGGTTEQALKVMEDAGLRKIYGDAVAAAARRAHELGDLFGKNV